MKKSTGKQEVLEWTGQSGASLRIGQWKGGRFYEWTVRGQVLLNCQTNQKIFWVIRHLLNILG